VLRDGWYGRAADSANLSSGGTSLIQSKGQLPTKARE